ncbi:cell wall metabolism sensor histidine kinase WalK [Geomicrobium sp. JCM 19039]|uniref:cell wall metabolism sensor histidine kinase WalK n=1 Tax=Geomicrobium sp. JCM 19039 TaxID=1460636 RepID=UPI00045F136F|nr:cell wall metabolism sensor histidine kinase WalK [Geomicrobium sp. JCM 19039]GAK12025.1 two-component sensor kinase SA14-24 [Geomicrobium sp. JCM 19039]
MEKILNFFKSFQFKLIAIYVLLLLIATQIIGATFMTSLESQTIQNYNDYLDDRGSLLANNAAEIMTENRSDDDEVDPQTQVRQEMNEQVDLLFGDPNEHVEVVDSNATIITSAAQSLVGQRNTDIQISRALFGHEQQAETYMNPDTGDRTRVIIEKIEGNNDQIIGVVQIRASLEDSYEQVTEINAIFTWSAVIALVITAIIGIVLSRTITRPVLDMQKQAKRMSDGDFSRQVRVYGSDEIGQLATSFNTLTLSLKEANATTEGERRKLSSVLSHMTDGVIATDELGRIILLNRQAEILLSMSSDEAMGQLLPDLLQLSDQVTPSKLYDYSDSMILDFSDEKSTYLLEANFSVIRHEDGPITGLITVLHDVTEQEKIASERREFVSNVSHELRTPLTTLKSYMEALEDGALEDPELAPRFLGVAQTETERMIRLVNDLLQLSKMDRDDIHLNKYDYNLIAWLHEVLDRFDMMVKDKNIGFERQLPPYPVRIQIDRDKMTQVIDNIISNAIKYSPDGGTITVGTDLQEEGAVIYVQDEGMGIPRENLHKIFQRFYRVDKARARNLGGTGLGLAIAKEMVEAHGGTIAVSSEWKKGTTITIRLPYTTFSEGGWSS